MTSSISLTFNIPSSTTTITIPVAIPSIANTLVIDWGDLSTTDTNSRSHTYTAANTYTVNITISYSTQFGNGNNSWVGAQHLISVNSWNNTGNHITSLSGAFNGASQLISVPPLLTNITDISYMFSSASIFDQDISGWDVSNVTNMFAIFYNAYKFNNGGNPLTWGLKTSNVTNMSNMFIYAVKFNQDISGWDVSNVTNMYSMFYNAISFNQDISNWNVTGVIFGDTGGMTSMLDNTNMSGTNYNLLLEKWSDQMIEQGIIFGAQGVKYNKSYQGYRDILTNDYNWIITDGGTITISLTFNIPIISIPTTIYLPIDLPIDPNTLNINWGDGSTDNNVSHEYIASGTFNVNITIGYSTYFGNGDQSWVGVEYLTSVNSWDNTDNYITSLSGAFNGASELISVPQTLLTNITDISYMFKCAISFNQNISSWDVSNITNMANLFCGLFDISQIIVTPTKFNQDISSWNVSSVNNMYSMFAASEFNNGGNPLTWGSKTSQVTNMNKMFDNALNFNQDISSWDVSNVENMQGMFQYASEFNNGGYPLSWGSKTSNVTNISNMFLGTAFNQDISSWNISSVLKMVAMFQGAQNFNQNLSSWGLNTTKVEDMSFMFNGAIKFNQDISSWDVTGVIPGQNGGMFSMLDYTNMSGANYDLLLQYWSAQNVQHNIVLGAEDVRYDESYQSYRDILTNSPKNWTITDGGKITITLIFDIPNVSTTIILPINDQEDPYTLIINWGDDTITDINSKIHTYNSSGYKIVNITIRYSTPFGNSNDSWLGAEHLISVNSWDNTNNYITSLSGAFNGASQLISVPPTLLINVNNISYMFKGATNFNQNISSWNVSNIYYMNNMFQDAVKFNQDISSWDVSNVLNIEYMFNNASKFNKPLTWGSKTSNVKYMDNMFNGAIDFNQNISSWNVSNVETMQFMFFGILDYTTGLPITTTKFNQDISSWNVSKVKNMFSMFAASEFNNGGNPLTWGSKTSEVINMGFMFNGAINFNQDISDWNVSSVLSMICMFQNASEFNNGGNPLTWGSKTSKVTDMSLMFINTNKFNQDISDWNVSSVLSMLAMFQNAIFNQDISSWDVSKVENMNSMFASSHFNNGGNSLTWGSKTLNVTNMSFMFYASNFNQDISSWDVSKVENMNSMFEYASNFNNGGKALTWGSKTSKVIDMRNMFSFANAFNQDISDWDVSSVINMYRMFNCAIAFNQDISSWNVSSVENMVAMFQNTTEFASTYNNGGKALTWGSKTSKVIDMSNMFRNANAFNQDISGWDVSKVTSMYAMFTGASAFNQDISRWNVLNVTNMRFMFASASAFNQDISGWDVSKVESMESMFCGLFDENDYGNLITPNNFNQDISRWDVSSVTNMYNMFSGCNFNKPLLWGSKTSKVTNMIYMFQYAKIFNQNISGWDVSNVTDMSYMFQGAANFNQDISSWNVTGVIPGTNGGMTSMLDSTNMSNTNYNLLLQKWSNQNVNNNIIFGALGVNYSQNYEIYRNKLINQYKWVITDGDIPCYARGTRILCKNGNIPIEYLKPGMMVHTYKHGLKEVEYIKKNTMINNPNNSKYCMYRLRKKGSMKNDLIVTGGHGILVSKLPDDIVEPSKGYYSNKEDSMIDDKYLIIAGYSNMFKKINNSKQYEYYHFNLKDDKDRRFGILANGVLSESTYRKIVKN